MGVFVFNCQRGNSWIDEDEPSKAFTKDVSLIKNEKLGSKMIRYHRSLNHNHADGLVDDFTSSLAPYEIKSLGSGESKVARLKPKEIDGRAPPGGEPALN